MEAAEDEKNHEMKELPSTYQFAEVGKKLLKRLMVLFSLLQRTRQT